MKAHTSTLKILPESRVRIETIVKVSHFAHALEHEIARVAQTTKIPGFRPGKAPAAKVIENAGKSRLEAGALDHAIEHAYMDAVAEHKISPLNRASVDIISFVAPAEDADPESEVAKIAVEVDVLPEVDIKGWEKIRIKPIAERVISDKDIDIITDRLRQQNAILKEVEAGATISNGMWVDIGFKGSVDGVARENMNAEHHALVVGENTLIPGFEEELIGLKVGDAKTFKITFPKTYHAVELQGKVAEFAVTIHEVKDMILPSIDDEFAGRYGHKKSAELIGAIRESLERERDEEHTSKVQDAVLEELLKLTKFEVPKVLVEQEEDRLKQTIAKQLAGMPMNEDLAKQAGAQAAKNVRIGIALGKIIEEQKFTEKENAMQMAMDLLVKSATGK